MDSEHTSEDGIHHHSRCILQVLEVVTFKLTCTDTKKFKSKDTAYSDQVRSEVQFEISDEDGRKPDTWIQLQTVHEQRQQLHKATCLQVFLDKQKSR